MDGEQIGERLGQLTASVQHLTDNVSKIDTKLDRHVHSEEDRLKRIEEQLSLGRFMLLAAKAVALTIVAALAFKFGDISALWKSVLKP
jgi:hypothetical protein